MVNEKSTIRSLRLKETLDNSMLEIAKSKNISYNSLVSQIFAKYVEWDIRTEKYVYVHLSKAFFKGFKDTLKEEDLVILGERLGTNLPKEFIMFWWKQVNIDTLFDYIDIISRYAGIFQSERVTLNNTDIVTLHHDLGRKWSSFLGSYFKGALMACLNITPQIELTENSVIASFKHNKI